MSEGEPERQERTAGACVNEKGWGLVVGERSKGMSEKAGIPQSSFKADAVPVWGVSHNAWLCHRHGDANDKTRVQGGGGED